MHKRQIVRFSLYLTVLIVVIVCFSVLSFNHADKIHSNLKRLEGAGIEITHYTSGIVPANTLIAVRYKDEQVSTEALHTPLHSNPFTFTPQIEGQAYWADPHTLVFAPAVPLYEPNHYYAELDLTKIFPDEPDLAKFEFDFITLGQKVINVDGYFAPAAESAEEVYFLATFTLAEPVEHNLLQKALQLKIDGANVTFELNTKDNRQFSLISEPLTRHPQQNRQLTLTLAKAALAAAEDVQQTFVLTPLISSLQVVRIEEEKLDENSQVRIIFTEPLQPDLDYQGYLHITPTSENYRVKVDNNSLIITGPFKPREQYSIRLFPGITSVYGQKLAEQVDFTWEVKISDRNPAVEFMDSGMILPSSQNKKIVFRTMNVERLRLMVKRVKEDNMIKFFNDNSYRPYSYSFDDYNRYAFQRYGEIVADQIVEIGQEANKWIQTELDLSRIISDHDKALYIIQLSFDANQVLYLDETYHDWYFSGYLNERGKAVKHLMISDIGITAKELAGNLYVYLTNVLTTEPIADAVVMVKDRDGKLIDSVYSNEQGLAVVKTNQTARYLEVRTNDDYALMSLLDSLVNQSVFDIGGVEKQGGVSAYIYTDRGVYRPGDQINLAAIVRNETQTFPDHHPVTLRVYNPQERLVYEAVNNQGIDGFYAFNFATSSDALTGVWKGVLEVGGRLFTHDLFIEAIVPYRLAVNIEPEQGRVKAMDQGLNLTVSSQYLFGAPASNLESEVLAVLESYPISFSGYSNFIFTNQAVEFEPITTEASYQTLDADGVRQFYWKKPQLPEVPSALRLRVEARVFEPSGRAVPVVQLIPVEHYPSYVGIMALDSPDVEIGQNTKFVVVHLSASGMPIANSQLNYRVYHCRQYWWWEYSSEASFRRYYKSSEATDLVTEGMITTNQEGFGEIPVQINDYGVVLLEVTDPEGGHTAGYFFTTHWWGETAVNRSADIVNLKLNKAEYLPGETAYVTLNNPAEGRALVTVEKEGKIMYQSWEELTAEQLVVHIEVKEEYIPNAYVSVVLYQPYGNTDNDLPLRMYGIAPLYVRSEGTKIDLKVEAPEEIHPEEEFTIKIQTQDQQPCQLTVAVVDEGLLSITGHKTPQPWEFFFAKQRLLTKTYDNFSDIINLTYGYIHNHLAVGGDGSGEGISEYRELQIPNQDVERFPAVSLFYGPIQTDDQGYAELKVQVPNYLGQVRVMVVAVQGNRYGSAQRSIPVTAPLMVLPTLPRVLAPLDQIRIPVSVFTFEASLGEIEVSINTNGPVEITGPHSFTILADENGRQEVFFELQAAETVGTAEIIVTAEALAEEYHSQSKTTITIRPDNPYIYLVDEQIAGPGCGVEFIIPSQGIAGTDKTQLVISSMRGLNINHRLQWLVRYPYGCVEQVTSAVFPQLYLPQVYKLSLADLQQIDVNINAAIAAYLQYQLASGAFSYWPNENYVNIWANNYVGLFLLEAKAKGYHIPAGMMEKWLAYQIEAAKRNDGEALTRAYRLYLLAQADKPVLSAMNYMRESELAHLSSPAACLLAAAYHMAGYPSIAQQILAEVELKVEEYQEPDDTFGSALRDQALMLDVLTLVGDYTRGVDLYNAIADALSSPKWLSTQTSAYALMAVTKYVQAVQQNAPKLTGLLTLPNQGVIELETNDTVTVVPLDTTYAGQKVSYVNTADIPVFVTLEWEGISKRGDIQPQQSNLTLTVSYLDQAGNPVDISRVTQGATFYVVYHVAQTGYDDINEVALVQILPSGWEIENLRLLGGQLPQWAYQFNLGHEEFVDIRDDHIMWFFDLDGYSSGYDFIVKINAVTQGKFYLPPTLLEAMYNNDYKVITEGQTVEVVAR